MSGMLAHMLKKIHDLNSRLERIESRNTKAWDNLRYYKYHDGYLALEMTIRIVILLIGVLLKKRK